KNCQSHQPSHKTPLVVVVRRERVGCKPCCPRERRASREGMFPAPLIPVGKPAPDQSKSVRPVCGKPRGGEIGPWSIGRVRNFPTLLVCSYRQALPAWM